VIFELDDEVFELDDEVFELDDEVFELWNRVLDPAAYRRYSTEFGRGRSKSFTLVIQVFLR